MGSGELIEVIGDVSAGDRIVVRGAERLSSGMNVDVQESEMPVTSSAANP